jgi:protein-S-isoprenylcysteine O-methyltransferase Ste14
MNDSPAYGLWGLVIINSFVFILFSYSFFKPRTTRDWRSFSAFSAFLVALFAEMYGFPLTIYFLSGWLQTHYPNVDWFSHDAGHLLEMMFGWKTNPHAGPFHLLSFVFIFAGFFLISAAWKTLLRSAAAWWPGDRRALQLRAPSAIRWIHSGHVWLSCAVANASHARDVPVLVVMYVKLARNEERDALASFGDDYRGYMVAVPAFIPHLSRLFGGPAQKGRRSRSVE